MGAVLLGILVGGGGLAAPGCGCVRTYAMPHALEYALKCGHTQRPSYARNLAHCPWCRYNCPNTSLRACH